MGVNFSIELYKREELSLDFLQWADNFINDKSKISLGIKIPDYWYVESEDILGVWTNIDIPNSEFCNFDFGFYIENGSSYITTKETLEKFFDSLYSNQILVFDDTNLYKVKRFIDFRKTIKDWFKQGLNFDDYIIILTESW